MSIFMCYNWLMDKPTERTGALRIKNFTSEWQSGPSCLVAVRIGDKEYPVIPPLLVTPEPPPPGCIAIFKVVDGANQDVHLL